MTEVQTAFSLPLDSYCSSVPHRKTSTPSYRQQLSYAPPQLRSDLAIDNQRTSPISHKNEVDEEEDFVFPSYDHAQLPTYSSTKPSTKKNPSSNKRQTSMASVPNTPPSSVSTSRPASPVTTFPLDDSCIRHVPSRHVDYLSYNWVEKEIISSWRYITSSRKEYENSARLENASWRTWAKSRFNLKTVEANTLNWSLEINRSFC
jgi:hypothetical protein